MEFGSRQTESISSSNWISLYIIYRLGRERERERERERGLTTVGGAERTDPLALDALDLAPEPAVVLLLLLLVVVVVEVGPRRELNLVDAGPLERLDRHVAARRRRAASPFCVPHVRTKQAKKAKKKTTKKDTDAGQHRRRQIES